MSESEAEQGSDEAEDSSLLLPETHIGHIYPCSMSFMKLQLGCFLFTHGDCKKTWPLVGCADEHRTVLLARDGTVTMNATQLLSHSGFTDQHLTACYRPQGSKLFMCRKCWTSFKKKIAAALPLFSTFKVSTSLKQRAGLYYKPRLMLQTKARVTNQGSTHSEGVGWRSLCAMRIKQRAAVL